MTLKEILTKMVTRKNPDDALAGAKEGGLEKTLGVWDLIILGVGAIIGSGIFAVVGTAAAETTTVDLKNVKIDAEVVDEITLKQAPVIEEDDCADIIDMINKARKNQGEEFSSKKY